MYETFFVNREGGRRGGGVSLLAHSAVKCEPLSPFTFTSDYCEVLSVLSSNTIYSLIYLPPNGDERAFLAWLDSILQYINDNNYTFICGGDFNIDMSYDTPLKHSFETILLANACFNTMTAPTRITTHSATLLDLFITNIEPSLVKSGVVFAT